jgi:transcriptional regulator GlxA family with amidase domain
VATLDMMHDLVVRFAGEALGNEVANALVHTRRPPDVKQRNDTPIESAQHVSFAFLGRVKTLERASVRRYHFQFV